MEKKSLVLASGSPRRKELLSQLGYEFSVLVTDVEECNSSITGYLACLGIRQIQCSLSAIVILGIETNIPN